MTDKPTTAKPSPDNLQIAERLIADLHRDGILIDHCGRATIDDDGKEMILAALQAKDDAAALNAAEIRAKALEEAAAGCYRHAKFCKDEAHRGGNFQHLMMRHEEAKYNATCILALIKNPTEEKP